MGEIEILMINDRGIMISVQGQDYFLSYNRVPWMKDATNPNNPARWRGCWCLWRGEGVNKNLL